MLHDDNSHDHWYLYNYPKKWPQLGQRDLNSLTNTCTYRKMRLWYPFKVNLVLHPNFFLLLWQQVLLHFKEYWRQRLHTGQKVVIAISYCHFLEFKIIIRQKFDIYLIKKLIKTMHIILNMAVSTHGEHFICLSQLKKYEVKEIWKINLHSPT